MAAYPIANLPHQSPHCATSRSHPAPSRPVPIEDIEAALGICRLVHAQVGPNGPRVCPLERCVLSIDAEVPKDSSAMDQDPQDPRPEPKPSSNPSPATRPASQPTSQPEPAIMVLDFPALAPQPTTTKSAGFSYWTVQWKECRMFPIKRKRRCVRYERHDFRKFPLETHEPQIWDAFRWNKTTACAWVHDILKGTDRPRPHEAFL